MDSGRLLWLLDAVTGRWDAAEVVSQSSDVVLKACAEFGGDRKWRSCERRGLGVFSASVFGVEFDSADSPGAVVWPQVGHDQTLDSFRR